MIDLQIVALDPGMDLPAYARPGDAGLDLRAREAVLLPAAGGRAVVPTGIAVRIPDGYGGFVQPRSGLAAKHGVTVLNSPGLIDSGYRDELKVALVNTDPTTAYQIERGDRIAQLVVLAVAQCRIVVTDSLDGENRGGGFGHTGR